MPLPWQVRLKNRSQKQMAQRLPQLSPARQTLPQTLERPSAKGLLLCRAHHQVNNKLLLTQTVHSYIAFAFSMQTGHAERLE